MSTKEKVLPGVFAILFVAFLVAGAEGKDAALIAGGVSVLTGIFWKETI